jgi:N-dimethylarginine dimethylaminohydrolase
MCPPRHFDVVYQINPWMHPGQGTPVDQVAAMRQWSTLRAAYEAYGHTVETVRPRTGLPDMVYAANSAFVLDGTALLARFRHPERQGEEAAYARWFTSRGFAVHQPEHVHEGEGDMVLAGDVILVGSGFRTDPAVQEEVADLFDRQVIGLELVDARWYHLDTALFRLSDELVAYYPGAFSLDSQQLLAKRYPDALVASEDDALAFGLNALSDGTRVFLPARAEGLATQIEDAGFVPVPIELPELFRGGGSVKCCTLELRR